MRTNVQAILKAIAKSAHRDVPQRRPPIGPPPPYTPRSEHGKGTLVMPTEAAGPIKIVDYAGGLPDPFTPSSEHSVLGLPRCATVSDYVQQLAMDVRVLAGRSESIASIASYHGTELQVDALLSIARDLRSVAVEIDVLR